MTIATLGITGLLTFSIVQYSKEQNFPETDLNLNHWIVMNQLQFMLHKKQTI
jgi:hypothetical protein